MRGKKARGLRSRARLQASVFHTAPAQENTSGTRQWAPGTYRRIYQDSKRAHPRGVPARRFVGVDFGPDNPSIVTVELP